MTESIQSLHDEIVSNEQDPRNINVLEVLEEVFGVQAVTEWLETQK